MDLTTLYDMLEPHIIRTIQSNKIALNSSSGSDGSMEQHALYGAYHTGQLDESQAPWIDSKITFRIADHAAQADVHHAKKHNIFDTANHEVIGGTALDLIGQNGPGSLARITPSANPGAAAAVLRTNDSGGVTVQELATIGSLTVGGSATVANDLSVGDTLTVTTKVTTPSIESPIATSLAISAYNKISLSSGEGIIQVMPSSSLQSDNFTSQLAGWRMTYAGELDARYMYADQLTIKLFMADYEVALAGSQMITKSITTTSRPFVVPYPGSYMYLYVNDLPSAEGMACFEEEDRVRLREYSRTLGSLNVSDCWGMVSAYTPSGEPKEQRWSYQRFGTATISTITQTGTRTTANTTGTTLTTTKPSGVTTNSFLIALVVNSDTSAIISPPSGFTLFGTQNVTGMRVSVYYKFAGGSEPANYSWTFSLSNNASVSLHSYSGVSTSHPIGSYNIVTDTEPGTQLLADSNYGASEGDLFMILAGIANANAAVDNHPDMTERTDQGYGGMRMWVSQYLTAQSDWVGDMTVYVADGDYAAPRVTFAINLLPAITAGGLTLYTGYMTPGKTIAKESHALDYGMPGNGWIESTTVDGAYGSNSPYTRVVSWATHPAVDPVVRSQLGNLKGIFGVANEFGLFAGNGVTDASSYVRLSSYALRLNNVPLQLWSSGQQKVNLDASGTNVWFGQGSGDKRLSWDGFNLAVAGAITISGVSGFAGSGYLKIGSGTKDTNLNGWQFDSSEIVGQAGGVDQVVMNTSGKIVAGGGDVTLDADGIKIKASASYNFKNSLSFVNGSGGEEARMFVANSAFATEFNIASVASGSNRDATVNIDATPSGSGVGQINLAVPSAGGTINLTATQRITLNGPSNVIGSLDISPTGEFQLDAGGLSVGRRDVNYSPTTTNWSTAGTTLLLTGQNYSVIGFHDADTRVDFIRVGAGTMTLGYDGGWGSPYVSIPGGLLINRGSSSNGALTVGGTAFNCHFNYDAGEDTYIRGGKLTSKVLIGDVNTGDIQLGSGAGSIVMYGNLGTTWDGLSFGSGWANYGGSYQTGQVKKVGDLVFLRGLVYRFTGTSVSIATLPVGYRPPAQCLIGVLTNTGIGRIDIQADGQIVWSSGGTDWIQLDTVFFSVA